MDTGSVWIFVFRAWSSSHHSPILSNLVEIFFSFRVFNVIEFVEHMSYLFVINFGDICQGVEIIFVPILDLCWTFEETESVFLVECSCRWVSCLQNSCIIDFHWSACNKDIFWFHFFRNWILDRLIWECSDVFSQNWLSVTSKWGIWIDISWQSWLNVREISL
mgnify:CR=1 FL=1